MPFYMGSCKICICLYPPVFLIQSLIRFASCTNPYMVLSRQVGNGVRSLPPFSFPIGYKQSASNASLFINSTAISFTLLLVYVDDVTLAGNTLFEFTSIKVVLHEAFKIKDLGQIK